LWPSGRSKEERKHKQEVHPILSESMFQTQVLSVYGQVWLREQENGEKKKIGNKRLYPFPVNIRRLLSRISCENKRVSLSSASAYTKPHFLFSGCPSPE
jgi:hypothetical protein